MAIGPVQLLVLGFSHPNFEGKVLAELDRLKEHDVVRVIDAIVVHKDAEGDVTILERTDLVDDAKAEFGATVGALIGLGVGGGDEEVAEAGAVAGAEAMLTGEGPLSAGDEVWDVIEDIPPDTATAIVLLEHRWALPLRDAIRGAGGFHVADGWIHPLDLVAIGAIAAEAAAALES